MIKKVIKDISVFLPLFLEAVEWNDPNLILIGKTWSFSTISCWRIINGNKLICGCYDKEVIEVLDQIKNTSIVSIEIQSNHLFADPVFIFSNGYKLEVFSTTYYEPWIFGSPSGIDYDASPSE